MSRLADIHATLRSLDPAEPRVDPTTARARADLEAILATDPATCGRPAWSPSAAVTGRPRRAARTARRVALVGALTAAVAAGMVATTAVTGGDRAFATWTAVPGGMPVQQRPEAAADCREDMQSGAGADYARDLDRAEPAIAESRGVWTTVVLAGADGFSATCITDDSSFLFGKGMIGSIGRPTGYRATAPRELFATDLGVGSMNGRDISVAVGHAGSDIVAAAYFSRAHGRVAATVSHGRFALWLPGDDLKDSSSRGAEIEVTYRDGTTATRRLSLR